MSNRRRSSKKQASLARSGTFISSAQYLRVLLGTAAIAVCAFIVYSPSINGGFVMDDDLLLTESNLVKASDGLFRFWCSTEALEYHPLTNSMFWIEWRLWGMNPTGYHLVNLIFHVSEALLIWRILRKLSIPGAFLSAVIFTVHPVNVESVAWIAQRRNVLAMLFFLLSILWYLKFDKHARRPTFGWCPLAAKHTSTYSSFILHPSSFYIWYWLSLAAFVLAMLSKGSAAVLPVLLLAIVWWLRPVTRWDLLRTAPFFAIALTLTEVHIWFQRHGAEIVFRTASFAERLLGAGCVVWFYLYKALLPVNLAFIYPQWDIQVGNPLWWLPLLAIVTVTVLLWRYREGLGRPFLFAWGFFCAALIPVMGLTDVGFMRYSLVADHYQHIAIIGVIALAAAGWSVWHRQARGWSYTAGMLVAVAAVGVLAFLGWRQSGLYRDEITLYQATLEKNPDCWMAHTNLGADLDLVGRIEEAIEHYEQALRLKPDFPEAHNNLGIVLGKTGRLEEAIKHYQQALALKSDYPEAHYNLGSALLRTGRLQEAIEHYQQALALKPDYQPIYNNLGVALVQIGRPQEAIAYYRQALALNPDITNVYHNMALAYASMQQPTQAIAAAQKALELARSQGQTAQAKEIEDWLNTYRAGLSDLPDTPLPSKSATPTP